MSKFEMVTEVGTTSVVDRSKLNKLSTEELAAQMALLYGRKDHSVILVDDPRAFFSVKNLMQQLDTNGAALHVILAQKSIELTPLQLEAIAAFASVKQSIEDILIAQVPPAPPYPFAEVPKDWTLDGNITFTANKIRRTSSTRYSVSNATMQGIWTWVAPFWAGRVTRLGSYYTRAGGGHTCYARVDRVEVGCQSIQRHELEQVALRMGWAFPEMTAGED